MHLRLTTFAFLALCSSCCPNLQNKECPCATTRPQPVKHVVMVPGFLERDGNYKMLRERLEKNNIACLVVHLKPSDGRTGLDVLAESLKEQVEAEFGTETPISLVAYSMGGLVSRYYLQNLDGAKRCEQFITLATPHHGTLTAHLYPGRGTQQMRPESLFLKQLEESSAHLGDMPVTSYRTPLDLIIIPSTSSVWDRAENRKHYALMHPLLLNSHGVLCDIEKRLLETD